MTSLIAKSVGMKAAENLFRKHVGGIAPRDPLYEEITDERGRVKRVKREAPPGLSKRDAKILRKVKKRAHYLDKGINLCGFRVGYTFFIGLVPVVGDIADATLNYVLVVRKCKQAELPPWLVSKMLFNNAVSAGVGFVPLAGDIVAAAWKANSRNALLLEEFLTLRGQELLRSTASHQAAAVTPPPLAPRPQTTQAGGAHHQSVLSPEQVKKDMAPGSGLKHGEHVNTGARNESSKSKWGWGRKKTTPAVQSAGAQV
ncbi:Protein of unknown function DUF4112 [Phaffia rhodozyma]|uniref:Uncharacterized protein n=1 Tax=Phaffia rhodozyma TaxID=264483 RepID=A0A0F7STQ2_PHARH|nr:Protein of unknown function DUF4112 [Phaffia rhodozyma]